MNNSLPNQSPNKKDEEKINMSTFDYMVRHGDSSQEGNERERGLREKGMKIFDVYWIL